MKAKKMMLIGGKRSLFLLMTLLLTLQDVTADVTINSTNFPDDNFRTFLTKKFGTSLSQDEINATKEINVYNLNIDKLDGIKYFTQLETLQCSCNKLKYLDLTYNTKLIGVECDDNQLEQITVTSKNLQWLGCSKNNLEAIGFDAGTYPYLKDLNCSNNPNMTSVGVSFSKLPALKNYDCSGTKFNRLNILSSCPNLEELMCENITTLEYLDCYGTALKTLSVAGCSKLKELECYNNKLTYLDVYGCSSLSLLDCSNNQLTTIYYLDGCKSSLQKLHISSNKFTSIDLSGYDNLEYLDCSNNRLSTLTLNKLKKLASVTCSNNSLLTSLDVSKNALTSLYLTGCSNLTRLDCNENQLYSLDLSTCENLNVLNCWDNKLEYLDLSNNKNINLLDCSCNPISSLNIKGYTNLSSLYCYSCRITSLDLSGCNKLGILHCYQNQLTSLILPKESTELNYVECFQNKLEGNMMDALVASLPNRKETTSGEIRMMIDPELGDEGNVCTPQNVIDAKKKNWGTYCINAIYDWYLYVLPGISTDIRTADADVDGNAPRYNMSGQRVGRDYKGIIIMNGKRVVIK